MGCTPPPKAQNAANRTRTDISQTSDDTITLGLRCASALLRAMDVLIIPMHVVCELISTASNNKNRLSQKWSAFLKTAIRYCTAVLKFVDVCENTGKRKPVLRHPAGYDAL